MEVRYGVGVLCEEKVGQLREFQEILPQVRWYIQKHAPGYWPELMVLLKPLVENPLGPRPLLPLACSAAVGGKAFDAVPVAAAWTVVFLSGGILDDLQDKDRPDALWNQVGEARTFNFSMGLLALSGALLAEASWEGQRYRIINRMFHNDLLGLLSGQDLDLRGEVSTIEDYWRMISNKTANAFAWACQAGAICGTSDLALIEACRCYGYHLGIVLQLFDDIQGTWEPEGMGDLICGKITLPVIYGLVTYHKRRSELVKIVSNNRMAKESERVRDILDSINAREILLSAALKERELAIAALDRCIGENGVTALTAYITTIFSHLHEVGP